MTMAKEERDSRMTRRRVVILGAGGHAKVVIAAADAAGLDVGGVYDDRADLLGTQILGRRVLGPLAAAARASFDGAVLAVGDNGLRKRLAEQLEFRWLTVVHPSAWVHESVSLGDGAVVFANAAIQPDAAVGPHAVVNTGATVDHDCLIGAFAQVGPGAHLSGNVRVGVGAFIGTGAAVKQGLEIGEWSTVGLGAAVISPVPAGVTVVGVPARVAEK